MKSHIQLALVTLMLAFKRFHHHLFLPLLILFICMEKGEPKPLTHYPTHWATDPNRAQIIYLILQPARGHLPIVSVLAKCNGLVQSPGGKGMNTVFRRKAEQRYEFRGWIYKRAKSNEFISNAHESRGRVCAVQSHDSQFTSQTVPCAPSKATPPLNSPRTMAIHHQGAEVRLGGGRTATQATSGREKHPLQLRFLRNPHQPRMGKYPHSQTGLLLTLSSKISYGKEEDVVGHLNPSGKAQERSLPWRPKEETGLVPEKMQPQAGKPVKSTHTNTHATPWWESKGEKISRWNIPMNCEFP